MAACFLCPLAVTALWLSLALIAYTTPSARSSPGEVPAPFNLSVFSYNFNTTLHWNYSRPADSPYFQLEIWNKGNKSWNVIDHCRKILHHYCDLSHEIIEPFKYYKVRVKAIVGTQESNYTKTEVNLISTGIIGPPRVNGSIQDGMIIIDIWHPDVPSLHERKTVINYGQFKYLVSYGNITEEAVDCDDQACSVEISVPDQLFCFFVQGISLNLPMTIEKSDKICISDEEKVPAPFNLIIASYNFNTTLHWKYSKPLNGAYFMVEILKKGQKNWTVIEPCRNTLQPSCDLSVKINDPFTYYKARVKAIVGYKESNYTLTEFSLVNVGIIGPPSVNGTIEDNMIVIDIWHPHVPSVHGRKTVRNYAQFNYIIYYGNIVQETDNCDLQACSAEILIIDQLSCFFVQGKSKDLPMKIEKSQKICITHEQKETSSQVVVITVLLVIGGLLLLFLIAYFIHRRMTKHKNTMPQSLSSVVRSLASRINVLPQYIPRYDNVSTSPIEITVEQKTFVEEEQVNTDVSAPQSVSNSSAYPPYQSSLTENDLKTEESGVEANSSKNSFHKDYCNSGNSKTFPEPKTEENITKREPEPAKDVKTIPHSFGYDKPHCPQELL